MTTAHYLYLAALAVWIVLLMCFSLSSRGSSPLYRWARRIFWAAAALLLGGGLQFPGINPVNWAVASCLGAPGYLALCALSLL